MHVKRSNRTIEAWLEFKIVEKNGATVLQPTATFGPKGLPSRLYWYSVLAFQYFACAGMADNVTKYEKTI